MVIFITMDTLKPYSDQLYSVLMFKAINLEEKEILAQLKEEALDEKTIRFIMETGEMVANETQKHFEAIVAKIEETDEEEDPEPLIKNYLEGEGINQELTEYIYTFVLLLVSKANAQTIIEEGQRAGKTAGQIKADIVASGQDEETVDTVYELALMSMGSASNRPYEGYKKMGSKHAIRSIFWIGIGAISYVWDAENYFPYLAFGIGILFLGLSIYRYRQDA